jgi:hypothetical protein
MSVWETLTVTGPRMFIGLRGRVCFEYRATVESRSPFDGDSRRVITMADANRRFSSLPPGYREPDSRSDLG